MTGPFGALPMTATFTHGTPPDPPVKIDRGVPIPSKQPRRTIPQGPFTEMEVGDSFKVAVSDDPKSIRRLRHSIIGQAGGVTRAAGIKAKFVSHYMPGEKAVRIWRVS